MKLLAVRSRPWLILISAAAGVVVALALLAVIPSTYRSTTVVDVSAAPGVASQNLFNSTDFVQQRASTYAALVQTTSFSAEVRSRVPGDGIHDIDAAVETGTSLFTVGATGATPQSAQQASAAAVNLLISQAAPLDVGPDGASSVKLTVVERPDLPTAPEQPNPWVFLVVGLAAGITVGLGIVWLLRRSHGRAHSKDIAEVGSDMGTVFRLPDRRWNGMSSGPACADYAERLAAVHQEFIAMPDRSGRRLLVAAPNEAHAETAHQVADDLSVTLVWGGRRVIVLRLKGDEEYEHRPGLSDVLTGSHSVAQVIFRETSGRGDVGPGQQTLRLLTASEREIRIVMDQLLSMADFVIIDAPPLSSPVGFPVMSRVADAVLLVAAADNVRADELISARATIRRLEARYLGLLLAPSEALAAELPADGPTGLEGWDGPCPESGQATPDERRTDETVPTVSEALSDVRPSPRPRASRAGACSEISKTD